MRDHPSADSSDPRFADETARRLLARAIEIDSTRSTEMSLGELWRVAQEAGVSRSAFDSAVQEFRGEALSVEMADARGSVAVQAPARPRPSRSRRLVVAVAVAVTAALAALAVGREVPSDVAAEPQIVVPATHR